MLRLKLNREPEWLELIDGVRVKVAPITGAIVEMALRDDPLKDVPPGETAVPFGIAVGKVAILEWEGVGDEDGNDLPVTPEGVEALLSLPPIWSRWQTLAMVPVFTLDAEKNGFAASPSGNTGEAGITAEPATASATSAPAA